LVIDIDDVNAPNVTAYQIEGPSQIKGYIGITNDNLNATYSAKDNNGKLYQST
jgi:hypothetical protein